MSEALSQEAQDVLREIRAIRPHTGEPGSKEVSIQSNAALDRLSTIDRYDVILALIDDMDGEED